MFTRLKVRCEQVEGTNGLTNALYTHRAEGEKGLEEHVRVALLAERERPILYEEYWVWIFPVK